MCKTKRCLKSLSVKIAKEKGNGNAIVNIPVCLLQCSKETPDAECKKLLESMAQIPCSQFDIEFDMVESGWIVFLKKLPCLLLIGGMVFLLWMLWVKETDDECRVSINRDVFANAISETLSLVQKGRNANTNNLMQAVERMAKMYTDGKSK